MNFGVSESVAHWARYRPESIATYHNGEIISYATLNNKINMVCEAIRDIDIASQRIAIALRDKLHSLIALIAILRTGHSVVPLNIGLPDPAISVNLTDTSVTSILYDREFSRYLSLLNHEVTPSGFEVSSELLAGNNISAYRPDIVSCASDEWGAFFSSGTTGIPKGIERTHYSVITELIGWIIELGLTRNTCFYIGRPIYYTGGLLLSLATIIVGGSIIINDYLVDNDFVIIWEDYQNFCSKKAPTLGFFIPNQIREFMRIVQSGTTIPLGAETILVMGAHISGQEKQNAARLLNSKIIESWGNSESLGTITDPEDIFLRPESIGRPFLTDEMFIIGEEEGEELGPGLIGRIAGSEDAGFEKYSNRPFETDQTKQNQLIISDDLGKIDNNGYFYVVGRKQETVIVNNDTLYLPDIECKIRSKEYVNECCVLPKTNGAVISELVCLVELAASFRERGDKILSDINQLLNVNEKIARLIVLSSIPKVPSGKIDRQQCQRMIEQTT